MAENSLFKATYIGGPTAIIEIGGLRFMTDPTLDPPGGTYHSGTIIQEKLKGPANVDIGRIDVVLLSHDQHFDNLDNAGRVLLQKVPKTYTTVVGSGRLNGTSIGLTTWQTEKVTAPDGTEIEITSTPARHGPAGIESLQGEVTGFLLSVNGGKKLEFISQEILLTMRVWQKFPGDTRQTIFSSTEERHG